MRSRTTSRFCGLLSGGRTRGEPSMTLSGTASGLWLVGVGSFVAALPRLIRAPRPELGLTWERMARRVDRTHVALETTGLGAIAVGSVVLAVTELGPWWFEAGVVLLAGLAVYLISAMKMRQLWLMRAATARDDPSATPAIASAPEQRVLALDHARWRRCLQRAFSKDLSWPPAPRSLSSPVRRFMFEFSERRPPSRAC